ncbi:MAG: UDP-N-acetylglucosamine 4,6-dehydratase (inverting) [Thermoanaerobaculaceae bacterium]|nr:UDP-N-acetylglucosamine 4,6-dehydratase (inverting) [Thermoanaerobaculaceae bacterium]
MNEFKGKVILITGGTGSFGKRLCRVLLEELEPAKVIIYSRDEFKQYEMQQQFSAYPNIRFFIGDVRDKKRLVMALRGVDYVVHAAALKQVPLMEYNPSEAVKTNILGAINIIEASIECGVKKVIALSTDKACNPINLYGATKLCADKLFVAGNSYSGVGGTKFSVVRYGNVLGSRGSVVQLFLKKKEEGLLPITDPRMTRFWITIDHAVRFVLKNFDRMIGGEIFVPKIPSMSILDLARALVPNCRTKTTGIRPGEKLHESIISIDDARSTVELDDCYVIEPAFYHSDEKKRYAGKRVPENFVYSSDTNGRHMTANEVTEFIKQT